MAYHNYIPKNDSARYKVLKLAFEQGGTINLDQAAEKLQDEHARAVVREALISNDEHGLMNRVVNQYTIAGYVRDHFNMVVAPKKEKYVGEPAAARYNKPFQPMRVTPWSIHADKLRDISFKTAGLAFPSGLVL